MENFKSWGVMAPLAPPMAIALSCYYGGSETINSPYAYDAGCGSIKKQNMSTFKKQKTKHVYF